MKYSRFETLSFVLGSAAIVASALVPAIATAIPIEIVAQLLMIVVLAGALHWGRNGGFVTALIAIFIYVGMRFTVLQSEGLSADAMTMIASRAVAYTVIGIVGGEVSGRIKYFFAHAEKSAFIDPETGVYSAVYAGGAIASALGQWARYETPYSLVVLTVTPAVWSPLKPSRMTRLMRQVASYIRNDVRMVDDVAYRGNGRFLALLPSTPAEGAEVVARRLRHGVVDMLGITEDLITGSVLACGADDDALRELASVLVPEAVPAVATAQSGATSRRTSDRKQTEA